MKITVIDCETTTHEKGSPFSIFNKLVAVGLLSNDSGVCSTKLFEIEYVEDKDYKTSIDDIRKEIEGSDLLVGFNIKFDLNWIRRYVPTIKFPPIWDCQLCHFIDISQTNPYPSLNEVAAYYGLPPKLDVVATQYWNNGVDTPDIPIDVLFEYLSGDLQLTSEIFKRQYANQNARALKELHFEDTLTLANCEHNGLTISILESKIREISFRIQNKQKILKDSISATHKDAINLDSPAHVSAIIFGGKIKRREQRSYTKILKVGPVQRTRYEDVYESLPPKIFIKKKDKDEVPSVSEPALRAACRKASKSAKEWIETYLEYKELQKLLSTYYEGISELQKKVGWPSGKIYPTYNQASVHTGRLSSVKPNAQNFPTDFKINILPSKEGYSLIECDAKQLEWVCACILSKDEIGLQEIKEGIDLHLINANTLHLPNRLIAKKFLFRLIYGGGAFSYAKDPDFSWISNKENYWQDVIDNFYNKYKGLYKWHKNIKNDVYKNKGKWVSPLGRSYQYEKTKYGTLSATQILNYPVQGFAADVMALFRVILNNELQNYRDVNILSTVHDSVLLESPSFLCNEIAKIAHNSMVAVENEMSKRFAFELPVEFKVEVKSGPNWGSLMEI